MPHTVQYNIQRVLDKISKEKTVIMFLTGSQAWGTATQTSDIDIYHIVRGDRWDEQHIAPFITPAKLGLNMVVDATVNDIQTACKRIKRYGGFHYWAAHNGIIIYDDNSAQSKKIHGIINSPLDTSESAALWLESADEMVNTVNRINTKYVYFKPDTLNLRDCARAIQACLCAALLRDNILFGRKVSIYDLASLFPNKELVRGIDLQMVDGWLLRKREDGVTYCNNGEYAAAVDIVNTIYERLKEM